MPRLPERARDPAEDVRDVPVRDREPGRAVPRHGGVGEVDRPLDVPVLEKAPQPLGGHDRAVLAGLSGGRPEVGKLDRAVVAPERRRGEVGDVGEDPSRVEPGPHRLLVHHLGPREVEEDDPPPESAEPLGAHEVAGRVDEGHVQAHRVGPTEQLLERPGRPHLRRELPGPGEGELGVVADDLHAERPGGIRDPDPNRPEADDPEHPSRQLEAVELPLPLLHGPFEGLPLHVEPVHEAKRRQHVARRHEQAREDQLLDRVGVRAGRVEYRHTGLAQAGDGDVVDPHPGPGHRLHAVRKGVRTEIRGAQQDRVRPLDLRPGPVAVGREAIEPRRRDVVEHPDPEHQP